MKCVTDLESFLVLSFSHCTESGIWMRWSNNNLWATKLQYSWCATGKVIYQCLPLLNVFMWGFALMGVWFPLSLLMLEPCQGLQNEIWWCYSSRMSWTLCWQAWQLAPQHHSVSSALSRKGSSWKHRQRIRLTKFTLQPFPHALSVLGTVDVCGYRHTVCGPTQGHEIIDRGLFMVLFLEQNPFASVKILREGLEFPSQIKQRSS